jgi:hypothetical protein
LHDLIIAFIDDFEKRVLGPQIQNRFSQLFNGIREIRNYNEEVYGKFIFPKDLIFDPEDKISLLNYFVNPVFDEADGIVHQHHKEKRVVFIESPYYNRFLELILVLLHFLLRIRGLSSIVDTTKRNTFL